MSRIQNILEKAERDGAVHRMRGGAERPPVGTIDAAALPPLIESAIAVPVAAPAAPARIGRTVAGTQLDPRLVATAGADPAATEQYRGLRTRILHADNGAAVNVVMITSPGVAEGKSLTAANLALTMAQEFQSRICIVDANLRQPVQHFLFGVPEEPGLADVLVGRVSLDEAFVTIEEHHVTLLPAGTAPMHPAELLGTTAMRRLLDTIRSRFDCVVVDAPAVAPLADVSILAPLVDSVLLVVRAGVTPKPAIHDAVSALDSARLLGIVLNDAL